MDLAVDVRLAQAARDELRVLRAEIEDQDLGVGGGPAAAIADHRQVEPRSGAARPSYSTR